MLRLLVEVMFLVQRRSLTKAYGIFRTLIQNVAASGQFLIHSGHGRAVRPPMSPTLKKKNSYATAGSDIDEAQRLTIVGTLLRQNMRVRYVVFKSYGGSPWCYLQEFTRANHQLFLEKGLPEEVINKWTEECDQEFATTRYRNWLRLRFCYGRKLRADGTPASPVPFTKTMKTTISPFPPPIDAPVPIFPYGDWLFDADDPELKTPTGAMMTNRTDERPPEFEPMKYSGIGIGVQPPDGRNMFPQVRCFAVP